MVPRKVLQHETTACNLLHFDIVIFAPHIYEIPYT